MVCGLALLLVRTVSAFVGLYSTLPVTEIAYHTRSTIDADIQFLTTEEWRVELSVLQDDLQDEDGNFKRASDKRTDAGIAWHKVHAVYPALTAAQLLNMTVDEIIASDPKIARTLDTTKHLRCANSKEFSKEINRYIDSKNQKRSEKKLIASPKIRISGH